MLPKFRAIDKQGNFLASDSLRIIDGKPYLYLANYNVAVECKSDTVSIHFPPMIDNDGEEIYASLNSDGMYGDIVKDMATGRETGLVFKEWLGIDYLDSSFNYDYSLTDLISRSRIKISGVCQ